MFQHGGEIGRNGEEHSRGRPLLTKGKIGSGRENEEKKGRREGPPQPVNKGDGTFKSMSKRGQQKNKSVNDRQWGDIGKGIPRSLRGNRRKGGALTQTPDWSLHVGKEVATVRVRIKKRGSEFRR